MVDDEHYFQFDECNTVEGADYTMNDVKNHVPVCVKTNSMEKISTFADGVAHA